MDEVDILLYIYKSFNSFFRKHISFVELATVMRIPLPVSFKHFLSRLYQTPHLGHSK